MKRLIVLVVTGLLAAGLAVPAALASGGNQLSASACGGGTLAINVVQAVTNDADSGVAGNAWAFDYYVRQIQVWQTAPGMFCGTVRYLGLFTTNAGPSPQNTGAVSAGVKGVFDGGYRTTQFAGVLSPSPAYPTRGFIGTFNYQCDLSFNCPGYVDWTKLYFNSGAGVSLSLAWWGWTYHAGHHGTWVNSIDGNSGDITG